MKSSCGCCLCVDVFRASVDYNQEQLLLPGPAEGPQEGWSYPHQGEQFGPLTGSMQVYITYVGTKQSGQQEFLQVQWPGEQEGMLQAK